MKEACEASLKALGVDAIGLYQYHRPDPTVPWAESVGALADLLDEGKILMAGVSNATVAQIDEAQQVLGGRLASVQNEFSPRFRSSEGELEHCEKLGIVFIPWSPMGGIGRSDRIEQNFPAFAEVAAEVGASPQQVNLAWMLAKGSRVIPIPGSSRPETAVASAAAADITLTPEQVDSSRRLLTRAVALQAGAEQNGGVPCCTCRRVAWPRPSRPGAAPDRRNRE